MRVWRNPGLLVDVVYCSPIFFFASTAPSGTRPHHYQGFMIKLD